MAERTALLEQLTHQLAQEETFLRQFYDVLMEEHQILSDREREKLEDVVGRKQAILDEFQQAVGQRMETLIQLGMPETSDVGKIQEFMAECAKSVPEITSTWETLQQLLIECKEQNEVNGAIIEVSTNSVQIALSILTGPVGGSAELYNAKGKTKGGDGPSGNSLAKA